MEDYLNDNCDNNDNCHICYEPLSKLIPVHLPCRHSFHFECIVQNIEVYNYKCPLCRAELDLTEFDLEELPSRNDNDVRKQQYKRVCKNITT